METETTSVTERHVVAELAALPAGEVLTVQPAGHGPISIFHTDEGLFAIDDTSRLADRKKSRERSSS